MTGLAHMLTNNGVFCEIFPQPVFPIISQQQPGCWPCLQWFGVGSLIDRENLKCLSVNEGYDGCNKAIFTLGPYNI